MLEHVYQRDYSISLMNYAAKKITYRKKVHVVSRADEKPYCLQAHRFIVITIDGQQSVARICCLFTHARLDEQRIFVVVNVGSYVEEDDLVRCSKYRFSEVQTIVGLPAVTPGFVHMLPVVGPKKMNARSVEGGQLPFETHEAGPDMLWWRNNRLAHFL